MGATILDQLAEKKAEAVENKTIAAQHAARKQAARERNTREVQAHVETEMNSERLLELADYKLGVDGRLMKGEYKRLSAEEEQGVYDMNARLMLEKQARQRAEKSGESVDYEQNLAADMVLNAVQIEKSKTERQRRIEVEEFNKELAKQKRGFDALERKAYRAYDHVETYTSTASVA